MTSRPFQDPLSPHIHRRRIRKDVAHAAAREGGHAPAAVIPERPARARQLADLMADGGDNAVCAAADLDREFPPLG